MQFGVKFGGMYRQPNRKRYFPEHFFGMNVSVFEIRESHVAALFFYALSQWERDKG